MLLLKKTADPLFDPYATDFICFPMHFPECNTASKWQNRSVSVLFVLGRRNAGYNS